jgi:hypothetical protein
VVLCGGYCQRVVLGSVDYFCASSVLWNNSAKWLRVSDGLTSRSLCGPFFCVCLQPGQICECLGYEPLTSCVVTGMCADWLSPQVLRAEGRSLQHSQPAKDSMT